MHDFEGDLLIGGMKLSCVHGELETEIHDNGSQDWEFSGRIVLAPQEGEYLQLQRRYRLELADGRAGLVTLSKLEPTDNEHVVAEFVPLKFQRFPLPQE